MVKAHSAAVVPTAHHHQSNGSPLLRRTRSAATDVRRVNGDEEADTEVTTNGALGDDVEEANDSEADAEGEDE